MSEGNGFHQSALEILSKSLTATTPSGLVVPNRDFDALVKAEARNLANSQGDKEGKGKLFSFFKQGWLGLTTGIEKTPTTPSYAVLREAASKSPIDAILLRARVEQVRHVAQPWLGRGQIGFDIVHMGSFDLDFNETPEIKALCHEAKMWLAKPKEDIHNSFKSFAVEAIKDEMVLDRKVIEIIPDSHGEPATYYLLPPETIKPRMEVLLKWMIKADGKEETFRRSTEGAMSIAAQRIFLETGVDVRSAAYIQEINNKIVAGFSEDELSIDIVNPSSEVDRWGQGLSMLEASLEATLGFARAWKYNSEYFNRDLPDAIMTILGNYDPQALADFKQQMKSEGPGSGDYWRMPVIASDPQVGSPAPGSSLQIDVKQVRPPLADMQWETFLRFCILLKCASFRTDPSLINFSIDSGASQTLISGGTKESVLEHAREEGFHSLLDSLASWLTRALLQKKRKYKDLMMIWRGLDDKDESLLLQTYEGAFSGGLMTRNEARKKVGLKPIKAEEGGEQFGDSAYLQLQQQKQMQEMQAAGMGSEEFGGGPPQAGPPARTNAQAKKKPKEREKEEQQSLRITRKAAPKKSLREKVKAAKARGR